MMMKRLVFLSCVVGCGGAPTPPSPDAGPGPDSAAACTTTVVPRPGTVLTKTGPVTGTSDGAVFAWKGIPYAAPPIGERRWRPPEPAPCSSEELATTAFKPQCPQVDDATGQVVGDEDCLSLNVWSPVAAAGAPVLVFVHGGGNTNGTASDPLYDGTTLATATGAVVVTVEYRLGALGFYASADLDAERPEHVSGNYGILDQIAALAWVRDNIAGFGGAPDRVLLFGESAGGQDTLVHVASPLSRGLFAAAIVESGGSYRTTLAQHEQIMTQLSDAVGCIPATLDCMRAVPAATLAAVPSAEGPLASGMQYVPNIDGYVTIDDVPDVIAQGAHNAVPLVIGTNADETSRMVPRVTTEAEYEAAVRAQFGAAANALLALYPATDFASPQQALVRMTTDVIWTCPGRRLARAASEHQTAPVYRYHFEWIPPGPNGSVIGATHGLELPFVFGTFSAFGFTPAAADRALSSAMQGYWSRLAATGDPDGAGALPWPRYDSATDPYLRLDRTIAADAGLATAQCDALDALVP